MKKIKVGHKGWLFLNALNMIVVTIISGYNIYLLRFITDYGLNKQLDEMLNTAKLILILLVVLLVLDSIGTLLKSAYIEKSLILMKKRYIHQLLLQDITQLQKEKTNTYRSNLTNDFDRFQDKYLLNLLQMMRMGLQFMMAIVLVATVNVYLVLVAFALLILFLGITSKNSKPVQKSEAKKSASLQKYTDYVQETLLGFDIIKQHQLESSRLENFIKQATNVQKDNYQVDVKETQVTAINQFIQTFIMFGLVVVGILAARETNASLGSIIVVASSFGQVMWPLTQFSPVLTQMKGIEKVLDEFDHNLQQPILDRHIALTGFDQLRFENANLGYDDEEKSILEHVTMAINKQEKILIVGGSGAGKSTILKTIRQSIYPKAGLVTINAHNIFDCVPLDYFSLFTTVDQIGFIFSGTVKENLTLFQPIDDQTCNQALKQVGLQSLELNQVLVNNGANVSGGQRARLMLARALILQAPVILCDEIFSSLELSIAAEIEKDLLTFNQTIINVSHIIFEDTLSLYDKIYVVENSRCTLATDIKQVWERMILSQQEPITQPIKA